MVFEQKFSFFHTVLELELPGDGSDHDDGSNKRFFPKIKSTANYSIEGNKHHMTFFSSPNVKILLMIFEIYRFLTITTHCGCCLSDWNLTHTSSQFLLSRTTFSKLKLKNIFQRKKKVILKRFRKTVFWKNGVKCQQEKLGKMFWDHHFSLEKINRFLKKTE